MRKIAEKYFQPKLLLFYILIFSFLVRLAGINYGLPLWLIDDEPPFTLAALKMLQLKTLLPALHLDEFRTILYYPPYLSYFYLLPFSILLAAKYLFFQGGLGQFIYFITSDLSHFFILTRFLNIALGVVSIYLLYRIAKEIFKSELIALLSAFFIATSLFHIAFSFVGRHWLPVSFLLTLIWWFLVNNKFSLKKRYSLALLTAGIGAGISPILITSPLFIFCWYVFYEKRSLLEILRDKYFYLILAVFIALVILPGFLYPQSFGFRGDVTFSQTKTVWDIFKSPFLFLKPAILSEPVLMIFAAIGLLFAFISARNLFWPVFIFLYSYSAIFYLFFRYEHRFLAPLFPLLGLMAALGFGKVCRLIKNKVVFTGLLLILAVPLILSLRFGYLSYGNDSRIHLRQWVEKNIPVGAKILVYARLTRLSSSKEAIEEQELVDFQSLRRVDVAEKNLDQRRGKFFHALNLYSIENQDFYHILEQYVRENRYQYLFMSEADFHGPGRWSDFKKIAERGKLLKSFGDSQEIYSVSIGQFIGNPFYLFKLKEFGPSVSVYKLY